MKKTSLVFSLNKEQTVFMTVIMSILTFISVLTFGIALAVSTGVIHWNNQWNKYATVQITKSENSDAVKNIFTQNKEKIEYVREITKDEMSNMIRPWISGNAKINDYLPKMYEVKLKDASHMSFMKNEISTKAKFLPHTSALKTSMSAGWKLVGITILILSILLASIGICISYISRNIAMLHKHELEILNQVGASDKFIVKQMQIIVGKISAVAGLTGFVLAVPILVLIMSSARSARVGLMATLSLSGYDWIVLLTLSILITIFAVYITKKTTLKILSEK